MTIFLLDFEGRRHKLWEITILMTAFHFIMYFQKSTANPSSNSQGQPGTITIGDETIFRSEGSQEIALPEYIYEFGDQQQIEEDTIRDNSACDKKKDIAQKMVEEVIEQCRQLEPFSLEKLNGSLSPFTDSLMTGMHSLQLLQPFDLVCIKDGILISTSLSLQHTRLLLNYKTPYTKDRKIWAAADVVVLDTVFRLSASSLNSPNVSIIEMNLRNMNNFRYYMDPPDTYNTFTNNEFDQIKTIAYEIYETTFRDLMKENIQILSPQFWYEIQSIAPKEVNDNPRLSSGLVPDVNSTTAIDASKSYEIIKINPFDLRFHETTSNGNRNTSIAPDNEESDPRLSSGIAPSTVVIDENEGYEIVENIFGNTSFRAATENENVSTPTPLKDINSYLSLSTSESRQIIKANPLEEQYYVNTGRENMIYPDTKKDTNSSPQVPGYGNDKLYRSSQFSALPLPQANPYPDLPTNFPFNVYHDVGVPPPPLPGPPSYTPLVPAPIPPYPPIGSPPPNLYPSYPSNAMETLHDAANSAPLPRLKPSSHRAHLSDKGSRYLPLLPRNPTNPAQLGSSHRKSTYDPFDPPISHSSNRHNDIHHNRRSSPHHYPAHHHSNSHNDEDSHLRDHYRRHGKHSRRHRDDYYDDEAWHHSFDDENTHRTPASFQRHHYSLHDALIPPDKPTIKIYSLNEPIYKSEPEHSHKVTRASQPPSSDKPQVRLIFSIKPPGKDTPAASKSSEQTVQSSDSLDNIIQHLKTLQTSKQTQASKPASSSDSKTLVVVATKPDSDSSSDFHKRREGSDRYNSDNDYANERHHRSHHTSRHYPSYGQPPEYRPGAYPNDLHRHQPSHFKPALPHSVPQNSMHPGTSLSPNHVIYYPPPVRTHDILPPFSGNPIHMSTQASPHHTIYTHPHAGGTFHPHAQRPHHGMQTLGHPLLSSGHQPMSHQRPYGSHLPQPHTSHMTHQTYPSHHQPRHHSYPLSQRHPYSYHPGLRSRGHPHYPMYYHFVPEKQVLYSHHPVPRAPHPPLYYPLPISLQHRIPPTLSTQYPLSLSHPLTLPRLSTSQYLPHPYLFPPYYAPPSYPLSPYFFDHSNPFSAEDAILRHYYSLPQTTYPLFHPSQVSPYLLSPFSAHSPYSIPAYHPLSNPLLMPDPVTSLASPFAYPPYSPSSLLSPYNGQPPSPYDTSLHHELSYPVGSDYAAPPSYLAPPPYDPVPPPQSMPAPPIPYSPPPPIYAPTSSPFSSPPAPAPPQYPQSSAPQQQQQHGSQSSNGQRSPGSSEGQAIHIPPISHQIKTYHIVPSSAHRPKPPRKHLVHISTNPHKGQPPSLTDPSYQPYSPPQSAYDGSYPTQYGYGNTSEENPYSTSGGNYYDPMRNNTSYGTDPNTDFFMG